MKKKKKKKSSFVASQSVATACKHQTVLDLEQLIHKRTQLLNLVTSMYPLDPRSHDPLRVHRRSTKMYLFTAPTSGMLPLDCLSDQTLIR